MKRISATLAVIFLTAGFASAEPMDKTLSEAQSAVGALAFRAIAKSDNDGRDLIFSPYSVLTVLTMAREGAAGETRMEMDRALSLSDRTAGQLGAWSKALKDRMDGFGPNPTFEEANRIWLEEDFRPRTEYLDSLWNSFGETTGAESLPMGKNPEGCLRRINGWTSAVTHGRIPVLLERLEPDTKMILTNAVWFEGRWTIPFDPDETREEPFHVTPERTKNVPMMKRTGSAAIGSLDETELLALSYGDDACMLVAMPPHGKMQELLASLAAETTQGDSGFVAPGTFHRWLDAIETQDSVDLWLPKFELDSTMELKQLLNALGIKLAFSDDADFSLMSETERLRIDEVVHKAFLKVDEKGSEAAAATAATMLKCTALSAPKPPIVFHVDRPFLCFIVNRPYTEPGILFMGKIGFAD